MSSSQQGKFRGMWATYVLCKPQQLGNTEHNLNITPNRQMLSLHHWIWQRFHWIFRIRCDACHHQRVSVGEDCSWVRAELPPHSVSTVLAHMHKSLCLAHISSKNSLLSPQQCVRVRLSIFWFRLNWEWGAFGNSWIHNCSYLTWKSTQPASLIHNNNNSSKKTCSLAKENGHCQTSIATKWMHKSRYLARGQQLPHNWMHM